MLGNVEKHWQHNLQFRISRNIILRLQKTIEALVFGYTNTKCCISAIRILDGIIGSDLLLQDS
jgi:hypothetical protein